MEEKHRIFDKGFNKILDLIKDSDPYLIDRFKMMLRYIPEEMIDRIERCEDEEFRCKGYNFEMLRTENTLNIEFNIGNEKVLKNQIFVRRIFEEDLLSDEDEIKIFSLYQRNTKEKMPAWVFEKQDGELRPRGEDGDVKAKELGIDVCLQKSSLGIMVIRYTTTRGLVLKEVKDVIDLDYIYEYLETEDEYEEELSAYIDLDDEFGDKLNGIE